MNGIINFLKPPGMTSHDGVYLLRRLSGIKKIGHTGTLDPMATGVLPLCIGNATRVVGYLTEDDKTYICEFVLGFKSDTMDIWGSVTPTDYGDWDSITHDSVNNAVGAFVGRQDQIPPVYSAIKVNGKKLYEYAREGKPVAIPPRSIEIYSITVKNIDLESRVISMEVSCSKGTYIRSLCHSIGECLGCGAVMSGLVRTVCGSFNIENAVSAEELADAFSDNTSPPLHLLTPMDVPLHRLPRISLEEADARCFVNGVFVKLGDAGLPDGLCRVYAGWNPEVVAEGGEKPSGGSGEAAFLGIGSITADLLRARKVLSIPPNLRGRLRFAPCQPEKSSPV